MWVLGAALDPVPLYDLENPPFAGQRAAWQWARSSQFWKGAPPFLAGHHGPCDVRVSQVPVT